MSKLIAKLRGKRGESLIETLVSIMIVAISSALLLGAISGAARINRVVRAGDDAYRTQLNIAERGQGDYEGELGISIQDGPEYIYHVYYAGEEGNLRSYDKEKVVTSR